MTAPPRPATRLLARALPDDRRGRSILGDLLEEWHARPAGLRRTLWYWREALQVAGRYAFVRRRLPGVAPADQESPRRRRTPGFFADDVRHALRHVRRAPAASALTILALGVGVAAPTVMYSLMVGVTRPLPVPEPEALIHVGQRYTPSIVRNASMAWLRPVLESAAAPDGAGLESVGAFTSGQFDLSGAGGLPERVRGARITPGAFRTLQVEPALGRAFAGTDASARDADVVILSDALWQERFGGDPQAVGRSLRIDGTPRTVIGVMPRGFGFPDEAALWLPADAFAADAPTTAELVGRLAPGATETGLRARVASVVESLREAGTVPADARSVLTVEPWSERGLDRRNRGILRVMLLLVSFILVIACGNVAHLFLAQALAQQRETAVQISVGATRRWLVTQRFMEAAVLAGLGGLLGLLIARLGVAALRPALAPRLSWWMDIRLDPTVVLFSTGLVALAALVTGLLPALHATRTDVAGALRRGDRNAAGGRGLARVTAWLVAGEVALTCALLTVAGLLVRGALRNLDTGGDYATASVLTAAYEVGPGDGATAPELAAFHREVVDRTAAEPGVAAAGLASHLPLIYAPRERVEIEGRAYDRPEDVPTTHAVYVSPGFLEALEVQPLRGRAPTWSDGDDGSLAVLVNEAFARKRLDGRDPLGVRVRIAPPAGTPDSATAWATVVGVVPALGLQTGRDPDDTGIYLPLSASPAQQVYVLARAVPGTDAAELAPLIRGLVAGMDPDLPVHDVSTLAAKQAATRDMESLFATLFVLFGAAGLLLAGVGLYGLMVFTVGRRLRELGIRAALGAGPGSLIWTAVRGGAVQVMAGLVVGLAFAALVAPRLGTLFMGYRPGDPVAYGAVALVLLLTGVAAAFTPARRALTTDVAEVIRGD